MKGLRTLVVLGAAIATPYLAATTQAYDLPAVNLGFTSFLDGGPPAGPGLYFTEYLQWYHSDRFRDKNGDKLALPGGDSPNLDAWISLSQLIYQGNQPVLLGGKWGVDVILPVVAFDLESKVLTDNGAGIGDLLIGPYLQWDPIMGKNGPIFMHRLGLQCITPTGRYSDKEDLNPGSNFFSFDPYWAGTVFILPKWTASWRVHYLWNDVNDDPDKHLAASFAKLHDLQAGQAVHANFATDYEVWEKRLRLGVNGYVLEQVTDTQVNGHDVGGRREQVVGIGPGALWHITPDNHLFFNVYFEVAAENRPEGQRYNLRYVHHF